MKTQRGEIATLLTLVSVGLLLLGAVAGTRLAQTGPRDIPQAAERKVTPTKVPIASSPFTFPEVVNFEEDRFAGCQKGACDPNVVGGADTGWCQANKVRCLKKGSMVCQLPDAWCDSPSGMASTCTGLHTRGDAGACNADSVCGNGKCEGPNENWETCRLDCPYSLPPAGDGSGPGGGDGGTNPPDGNGNPPDNNTGGGDNNGGNTGDGDGGTGGDKTPPAPSTDHNKYPNGFYVIKGEIINIKPTITRNITFSEISLKSAYYLDPDTGKPLDGAEKINVESSSVTAIADSFSGQTTYRFGTKPENYVVAKILSPIAPAETTGAELEFTGYNYNEYGEGGGSFSFSFPYPDDSEKRLYVCYPFGKKLGNPNPTKGAPTLAPTSAVLNAGLVPTIVAKCKNQTNDISYDYNTYSAPTPVPPEPTLSDEKGGSLYVSFSYDSRLDNDNRRYILAIRSDKVSLEEDKNKYSINWANILRAHDQDITFKDVIPKQSAQKRNFLLSFQADIIRQEYNSSSRQWEDKEPVLTCKPSSDLEFTIEANGTLWDNDSTKSVGKVMITATDSNTTGTIDSGNGTTPLSDTCELTSQSFKNKKTGSWSAGSNNQAFIENTNKWVDGSINALAMSEFISQLTRVPGVQMQFCDPTIASGPGSCSGL